MPKSEKSDDAAGIAVGGEEMKSFRHRSVWALVWLRFTRHKLALVSAGLLLIIALLAICAPVVATHPPNKMDLLRPNDPPSRLHPLGTDAYGRDVWARLLYGGRISLSVGLVAVAIYTTIGVVLGAVSGYYGGAVDTIIMRVADTVMSFPSLMIIILIVSIIGPSIYNIMVVIGILGWPGTSRLLRGEFLSLREREFVLAARMVGVSDGRIILRHILPNALYPVIVSSTMGVAGAILTEAGLSFLGLGVQPPTASWGNMLNAAQRLISLQEYHWQWVPPGIAISFAVLAINFIGDGLRDALDPRIRVS